MRYRVTVLDSTGAVVEQIDCWDTVRYAFTNTLRCFVNEPDDPPKWIDVDLTGGKTFRVHDRRTPSE